MRRGWGGGRYDGVTPAVKRAFRGAGGGAARGAPGGGGGGAGRCPRRGRGGGGRGGGEGARARGRRRGAAGEAGGEVGAVVRQVPQKPGRARAEPLRRRQAAIGRARLLVATFGRGREAGGARLEEVRRRAGRGERRQPLRD